MREAAPKTVNAAVSRLFAHFPLANVTLHQPPLRVLSSCESVWRGGSLCCVRRECATQFSSEDRTWTTSTSSIITFRSMRDIERKTRRLYNLGRPINLGHPLICHVFFSFLSKVPATNWAAQ